MRMVAVILVALLLAGCESSAEKSARLANEQGQQKAAQDAAAARWNLLAMAYCQDRGYRQQTPEFELCRKARVTEIAMSELQQFQQWQAQMMAPYMMPLPPAPQPRQVQTYCYQSGSAVLCNTQ